MNRKTYFNITINDYSFVYHYDWNCTRYFALGIKGLSKNGYTTYKRLLNAIKRVCNIDSIYNLEVHQSSLGD